VGSLFFTRVVHGDIEKILNFFIELKNKQSAIGWDINMATPEGPVTFSFFGGVFGEQVGIAAATTANGAKQLFTDFSRINNEQVNIIRSITKENARLMAGQGIHGSYYFDEISRLNNDLVNIQRELAKKNQELDYLNKLKNQFLGIAAHDLRSPLGVILGYSELIRDDPEGITPEERMNLLGRIYDTGTFMLGLINNLLDIANIESGTLELNRTEENLDEVIRSNIEMNTLYARSKNIQISYIPLDQQIKVMIDRPKIDQAITNYLTNALKYSFPGSLVKVLVDPAPDSVKVTVKDFGQGIREHEVQKLFKAFQRTSTRSTGGEKSTGLGLLIVKKIIEAHDGEVGMSSIFGQGSEFYFTLPNM
jgi:signal transduction histidine kinase